MLAQARPSISAMAPPMSVSVVDKLPEELIGQTSQGHRRPMRLLDRKRLGEMRLESLHGSSHARGVGACGQAHQRAAVDVQATLPPARCVSTEKRQSVARRRAEASSPCPRSWDKQNRAGRTPMILVGTLSMLIVEPSAARSPPKRRVK